MRFGSDTERVLPPPQSVLCREWFCMRFGSDTERVLPPPQSVLCREWFCMRFGSDTERIGSAPLDGDGVVGAAFEGFGECGPAQAGAFDPDRVLAYPLKGLDVTEDRTGTLRVEFESGVLVE